jgi:CRP-like cAMP-binding protein
VKNLPFMEVDSYFGEFELFDDSTRRWTVVAESNCILYTIPKNIFFDLLLDEKRQHTFLLELRERLSNFLLAEQETLKNIKKMEMSSQEVIEKFEKFENQNKVIN